MNHSVKRRRQALHQTHHHYYLNTGISVEAANLSDWRIESKKIDSVARIESFCPNWNALVSAQAHAQVDGQPENIVCDPSHKLCSPEA